MRARWPIYHGKGRRTGGGQRSEGQVHGISLMRQATALKYQAALRDRVSRGRLTPANGSMPFLIIAQVHQPLVAKPPFDFLDRMDAVITRRITVEGVEDVVFDAQSLIREGEILLDSLDEGRVPTFQGPGHEDLAEAVVPFPGDPVRERNPGLAGHV